MHVQRCSDSWESEPDVIMALESIAHVNRRKFLAAIRPVFVNGTETTEIRIAAIATLFRSMPSFLELQQLTAGALWERNAEVLNLIVTSFRNFAGSKNPFLGQTTKQPQLLLHRFSHIQTTHFRSSNRVFDFQDQKYGFSGGLQLVIAGRANFRISPSAWKVIAQFILRAASPITTTFRTYRR